MAVLGLALKTAWGVGQAKQLLVPLADPAAAAANDDEATRCLVLVRNGRIRSESLRIHSSHLCGHPL